MSKGGKLISMLALIVALAALAISMLAWVRAVEAEREYEARLAEMEHLHASVQQEIEALRAPTEIPPVETAPPAAATESYCNLIIGSWSFEHDALMIHSACAQVMSETAMPDSAVLVLVFNGDPRISTPIVLTPGEGSGSYVKEMDNQIFNLPEHSHSAEGDLIELRLEVSLADGQVLSADGGSWEFSAGELGMIAG